MKTIIFAVCTLMLSFVTTSAIADDAISQRQAAYKEIKAAMADIKDAMKADDFEAAQTASRTVAGSASQVTALFPAGSYEGDTRAKKKIWDNLADFQERQQKLATDADNMVTASQSNDPKELKAAFKTTSKNCKGCHFKYRQVF